MPRPRRSRVLNKSLFILALLVAATAYGAQPIPLADYRQSLQRGVDNGAYAEVAVGWIDNGTRQTWFFGRDAKPDNASAFEIGAASEIFTGLLLAQAAYEGKVRFQTPLHDLLPRDLALADTTLGTLTLQQLATHQTGLPALPPNLLPANADDPYADYSGADLRALLANYRRPDVAAARGAYSTLDAGLLGQLLATCYGKNLTDVLREKVLKPLGMPNTGFDDSLSLLAGHAGADIAPHWHFAELSGAAGLRSTVGDLLGFLQQNLRPQDSPLRAALLLARQAQDTGAQTVGLGWNIVEVVDADQSWPLVWRASRTAGFSTFLGFRTDRQQALVLLGNNDTDLSSLGMAWLEQRTPPEPAARAAVAPTAAPLDAYSGLYQFVGGAELIVRDTTHGLLMQISGQPASPLHSIGDDAFAGETLTLTFRREGGRVFGALVDVGCTYVQARRLSERAPVIKRTPIALDPKAAAELAGDYRLDDATLVRIRAGREGLSLQLTGRGRTALTAFAQDRYVDADATCEVKAQRDNKDAVTGLVVTFGGVDRAAPRVLWAAPSAK